MKKKSIFQLIDLLKFPVISEKSMKLLELNHYSFVVDRKITKPEIKKVIEFLFEVNVKKVNTLTLPIQMKRRTTKKGLQTGYIPRYKKAIIHLEKTSTIDFFDDELFEKNKNN